MCSVVAEFIALKPYSNGVRKHAADLDGVTFCIHYIYIYIYILYIYI